MKSQFYSGTSGLVLPLPKKSFPPEYGDKSRLTYYASLFNSIEINSSFYKIPQAATVKKWAESVPQDFKFTFKLWKEITHVKELSYNPDDAYRFIEVISYAGNKKGCLLVQFPPGLTDIYAVKLEKLLMDIKNATIGQQWKVAVEFRNRSWYHEETYEMLQQYHSGLVLHDVPASSTPFLEQTENFVYVRFHGPNGGYRGSYPDDVLQEYSEYIKDWLAEGKDVYAYFNNTIGEAFNNLTTLKGYVS